MGEDGRQAGAGRLVAVVVTHNRLEQLRETVARLLASSPRELAALVVVDNLSSDGTGDWLAGLTDPRVDILSSTGNLGGAGGFEWGMRHAVQRYDPDWLVLMDDDGRPQPGALARFHAVDRCIADIWAAAVFHPDGRICDMNRPSINPFWHRDVLKRTIMGGGREGFHLGAADYRAETPLEIDGASFVGLFVSRAVIARVGYPDGRLFLYGDDVLYTLGLSKSGGRILFAPDLHFEHDFSTMADGGRRFRPLWKSYYLHRNLLMVYRMAAGGFFWPALLVILPKWLSKVRYHGGERRAYLRLMRKAVTDGLLQRVGASHDKVLDWARTPD